MINHLKKLSSAQIWLFSITASILVIGFITGIASVLLKGVITRENLQIGFMVSLIVAILFGSLLKHLISQQKKNETIIHFVNPASGQQKKMAVTDAALRERSTKTAHLLPASHDIVNDRTEARDTVRHPELRQAIQNLDVLPAMPVIAQKLLALNLNTEEGERMLLILIAQDPQISAKIIGLANSAMIGASRRIISVKDAALLLGAKRVQSVAASIAIISLMVKAPPGVFNTRDLWVHGFRVAAAIQGIARFMPANLRPSDEQIFLAGTLHDIGYLVLAYLDPKLSDKLHTELSSEPARPAIEIEHELLEMCHDELGAELARHWSLPEEIITALRFHHYPDKSEKGVGQVLARMIDAAQKILPPISAIETTAYGIYANEWELLGIPSIMEEEVKEQVNERAEQAVQFANSFL